MAMSKKDFIELADVIRNANLQDQRNGVSLTFKDRTIHTLADFCQSKNSRFMRYRWLDYIAGKCGKSGGKIAA